MKAANHIPKASMCSACSKAFENCSNLEFESMPEVGRVKEIAVVICSEFELAEKICDKTVDMFSNPS